MMLSPEGRRSDGVLIRRTADAPDRHNPLDIFLRKHDGWIQDGNRTDEIIKHIEDEINPDTLSEQEIRCLTGWSDEEIARVAINSLHNVPSKEKTT